MSVSNLTNTKWRLNDILNFTNTTTQTFSIDFWNAGGVGNWYKQLRLFYASGEGFGNRLDYHSKSSDNWEAVYGYSPTWRHDEDKTIFIKSGTDVTNANLIAWLEANAVQVPVVDLSNTTWIINSITCPAGYGQFSVDFSILSQSIDEQTALYIGYAFDRPNQPIATANSIYCLGSLAYLYADDELEFSSGTDIANPDLIAWLTNNATLQTATYKTFDLSTLQLSAGAHTIQVKARGTGYRDSNFSNSVSYVVAQPSYSVTITCTNRNITRILCASNDNPNEYDLLLDNGDSQTVTVNVPQDKPYLNIETSGGPHSLNSISNATWIIGWKVWNNQGSEPYSIGGAVVEITGDNATVNMTGVSF